MAVNGYWARFQLGNMLERLRLEAGKTRQEVEDAKLGSVSKIQRLEGGKVDVVKPADIYGLAAFYGLSREQTDALLALASAAAAGGWIEQYADSHVNWLGRHASMEEATRVLQLYQPTVIPGLLQTPDYAEAVIRADPSLDEDTIRARVGFRLERQRAVFAAGPHIQAVLGAGALALQVGSPATMMDQVKHLTDLQTGERARIDVLPWSAGPDPQMFGAFAILYFDGTEHPDVVHLETYTGSRHLEGAVQVRQFRDRFEGFVSKSIPIEEYAP